MDQLLERMQAAIKLWLEVEGEDAPSSLELVGVQRISCEQTAARGGCPCGPISAEGRFLSMLP